MMDSSLTGHVTKDYVPDPQIYVSLIQECERLGKEGEFSTCFTELQRAFLKQRPAKLKSLIRLIKHWYQQVRPSRRREGRGAGEGGRRRTGSSRCGVFLLGWWSFQYLGYITSSFRVTGGKAIVRLTVAPS